MNVIEKRLTIPCSWDEFEAAVEEFDSMPNLGDLIITVEDGQHVLRAWVNV